MIRCPACRRYYEVDIKKVDVELKYIQCPICSAISLNPFYKHSKKQNGL